MDGVKPVASAEQGGAVEARFTEFCKVFTVSFFLAFFFFWILKEFLFSFIHFLFLFNYLIFASMRVVYGNCLMFFLEWTD